MHVFRTSSAFRLAALVVCGSAVASTWVCAQETSSTLQNTTEVAVLTPAAAELKPAASEGLTAPSLKAVLLVQYALAERGCRGVGISGSWDAATEAAVAKVLAMPSETRGLVADESLIQRIRKAPEAPCWFSTPSDDQSHAPAVLLHKSDERKKAVEKPDRSAKVEHQVVEKRQNASHRDEDKPVRMVRASPDVSDRHASSSHRDSGSHESSSHVASVSRPSSSGFVRPMGLNTF